MAHRSPDPDFTSAQLFLDAARDVVGEEGVQSILNQFGGSKVYIAIKPTAKNWLSALFGIEKAKRIGRALTVHDASGRSIPFSPLNLPLGFKGLLARTVSETDRMLIEGIPASSIARNLGIHERTVWRRRAKLVADGRLERKP